RKKLWLPKNSGAAGTLYDAVLQSLFICNHNMSTQMDTLLLEFRNQTRWRNCYVRDHATAAVPLLWSRFQVLETNRAEESQSHVHRIYFMGPITFKEPWHLLNPQLETNKEYRI
ncbi:hypothetical protein MKW98_030638, partial [Papaver atlanticum]